MKITFLGTTTLMFDDGVDQILFDAHLSRPSMFTMLFKKFNTDTRIVDYILQKHNISRLKAIFVSHSHYDHVLDAPYIANKTGAVIHGSKSTINYAIGNSVPVKQLKEFKDGSEFTVGNYKIKIFASKHSKPKWYNNDIGQEIEKPFSLPASRKSFKEGGSFDFLVENAEKKYLIRPSFNYVKGELDNIDAYIMFLGIAGISKSSKLMRENFFKETIAKVKPKYVVPIHWDNFMTPLDKPLKTMPRVLEDTDIAMYMLTRYCEDNNITNFVQLPLTYFET
ncbi:MAG: MBL fold metallo-hydrolase [Treponema sp.]|nr:MBL fold metallo-hydrolase [Treponema sp.]